MIVNEVAQWAVLLFLSVFVLGLTRQLGLFLVPRTQQVLDAGPALGSSLPASVLDQAERRRVTEVLDSRGDPAVALAFVDERCPGCLGLLDYLEQDQLEVAGTLIGVVTGGDANFENRVRRTFTLALDDRDRARMHSVDVHATPYLLIVDREFRVLHRDVSSDILGALRKWKLISGDLVEAGALELPADQVDVTQDPGGSAAKLGVGR